jgi:ketosteroid isomerase-like protein
MDQAEARQLLEELYAATSSGDGDRVRPLLSPEFEFEFDSVEAYAYCGVDGFCAAVRDWRDAWEEYQSELEECFVADEYAVAILHIRGRGKGSGVDFETQRADVWRLREGKLRAFRRFSDRAAALASLAETDVSPAELAELKHGLARTRAK